MVVRTPSWIFQSFGKLHLWNITLHGWPCKKQTSKFSAFCIEIWRNYQQNSYTRWWSDAILNISVISKATFTKILTNMNDPARNKPAKFWFVIMRFEKSINKTVIQDGGQTPSWITRACHICQRTPIDFLNTDFIPVPMTYNTSSHHWNCHGKPLAPWLYIFEKTILALVRTCCMLSLKLFRKKNILHRYVLFGCRLS